MGSLNYIQQNNVNAHNSLTVQIVDKQIVEK